MPESRRTIAIGDIHGCVHAFDTLLDMIAPQPSDTLVILGDFIDQGRESRQVIDTLIALPSRCRVVVIMGNHEEMMLHARDNPQAFQAWYDAGGFATLDSYHFDSTIKIVPDDHWAFIEACRDYFETDTHIFTHANYEPDLPMPEQPTHTLRWAILEEPYPAPHLSGKTVVVGHTEQHSGEVLDLGYLKCIDTMCWRYGWLTALDVDSGQVWQTSKWGVPRSEFAEVNQ
jgi:serine/threonine protein phosphatase 1